MGEAVIGMVSVSRCVVLQVWGEVCEVYVYLERKEEKVQSCERKAVVVVVVVVGYPAAEKREVGVPSCVEAGYGSVVAGRGLLFKEGRWQP